MEEKIRCEKENGIAVITLNRPDKMNAITADMNPMLHDICEELTRDDEVRVVIITGAGRAFCAGADLSEGHIDMPKHNALEATNHGTHTAPRRSSWPLTDIPKPTICALNGAAVGIGSEYVLQCDIRIASEKARFGQVFVLRGLVPDTGAGTYLLPRILGLSKACELLYSGEIIDAQEMLRIGLVSEVVAPEELMPAAMAMAEKMKRGAPAAVRMVKQLLYSGFDRSAGDHQAAEGASLGLCLASNDHKEGIMSFLEKREPKWTGT